MVGKIIFPSYTSDGHLTTPPPQGLETKHLVNLPYYLPAFFCSFFFVLVLTPKPQVVGCPPSWAPR